MIFQMFKPITLLKRRRKHCTKTMIIKWITSACQYLQIGHIIQQLIIRIQMGKKEIRTLDKLIQSLL